MSENSERNYKGFSIKSTEKLKEIKGVLKSDLGRKFMTRVLKIAINFKEDTIAAVVVARYNFDLEDCMVNFAIAEE